MSRFDGTVTIENARIIFRNFAGKEGMYNAEGDRNFGVILDPDVAEQMAKDGWNVKTLKPREDDESTEGTPWVQVSVGYKIRPPKIYMITTVKGQPRRTPIGEDEIELLDWVDIENVDMILRPYNWSVAGRGGIKAYLQTMYITIVMDALDEKYADLEDALPVRAGAVDE